MFVRRVIGSSMMPILMNGVFVICKKKRAYNVGDIVVCNLQGKEIIKRIHGKTENKIYVLGDNLAASTDSRQFGPIATKTIKGKCVFMCTAKPLTIKRL